MQADPTVKTRWYRVKHGDVQPEPSNFTTHVDHPFLFEVTDECVERIAARVAELLEKNKDKP